VATGDSRTFVIAGCGGGVGGDAAFFIFPKNEKLLVSVF